MLQTEKWTVTTLEGNFSATCTLNVAKKTNTGDEIYEDSNIKMNTEIGTDMKNKYVGKVDNTIATAIIPYAGNPIFFLIGIVLLIIIATVILMKCRNLKDVK